MTFSISSLRWKVTPMKTSGGGDEEPLIETSHSNDMRPLASSALSCSSMEPLALSGANAVIPIPSGSVRMSDVSHRPGARSHSRVTAHSIFASTFLPALNHRHCLSYTPPHPLNHSPPSLSPSLYPSPRGAATLPS
ncbi:hypothetical protein CesoFtcFv8_019330 [Champsocephalus esox]|uniref:Uncharacterized protein n=1 Tax=Champsocephalus esox TaxID=159716 RepID=A0AAN8BI29_9TELE|nr:hypothetical protein CesoFtcFv8_019330 [Champsocephalus esox]